MVSRKNRRDDEGFSEPSILSTLASPFRGAQEWIRDALQGNDSIRTSDSPFIVRILTLPFRLLWGFAVFMVQAWTTSRRGVCFLRGLPAMGAIVFAFAAFWVLQNYSRQISEGPTRGYHMFHRGSSGEHPEYALMFSKKLVSLRPDDLQAKFLMAEDIASTGDIDGAVRVMEYLATAPANKAGSVQSLSGYGDAHVWLSRFLQRKQIVDGEDDEMTKRSLYHLSEAVKHDPDNVLAKVSLADIYLAKSRLANKEGPEYRGHLENARDALVDLTSAEFSRIEQVMAMPQLVDTFVKLDDRASAENAMDNAATRVSMIARLNPEIFEVWLALVQSAVALKKYDMANDYIREGYQSVQTDETRRKIVRLASLVHLQNADDFVAMDTEQSYRNRLFALCRAIQANPRDVAIYQRLLDFVEVQEGTPQQERWLRDSVLGCPIPGVVHILVGAREITRGNVVQGQKHWRIGQQQYQTAQLVVHRLISVAAQKKEGFSRIGEMVSLAIEMFPDQPMLYETRGAMLKSEGRYEDALADLEIVVEKLPDLLTVHKHMSDCYQELGNQEKVDYHKARVQEILDQLEQDERELYKKVLDTL